MIKHNTCHLIRYDIAISGLGSFFIIDLGFNFVAIVTVSSSYSLHDHTWLFWVVSTQVFS
ncbi:hypothetical protein [Aquimarina muelleri]|uniref:hypothetical protein n=1 Tax=Aquimarina muelleri TaxID=279356 RepID=UPI0016791828|nr:hypothetical protein [Aquimarina muelleri]